VRIPPAELSLPRLMLVTDRRRTGGRPLLPLVAAAVRGGVGFVQIREKDMEEGELLSLVEELRHGLDRRIRLAVNGRPEIARGQGIGLHLPSSMTARQADAGIPFGRSAHDRAEADRAQREGASYVILGTVFPTASKPGHPGSGLALVEELCPRLELPVYAIGGITAARIPAVLAAGAHGVAVCGAILGADEPQAAAAGLAQAIESAVPGSV